MRTLVFDDFCFGNIGIPGDIGTIGKVRRKFEGAAFLYPPTRPEKQGKGVREGVPLMRHKYIWGFCPDEFEKPIQVEMTQTSRVPLQQAMRMG